MENSVKQTKFYLKSPKGFTLLESLVATLILTMGMSYVWYTFRTAAKVESKYNISTMAVSLAQSEIESLRILPKHLIQDTSYNVEISDSKILKISRTVFDSTDMDQFLFDQNVNSEAQPKWRDRPIEVKIEVYVIGLAEINGSGNEDKPIVTLITILPDYIWY